MKLLALLLSLTSFLFASPIVTENDPSTIVNGVSVITGDLYTFDEDIVVAGVEPLHFKRSYLSSIGDWTPYPHLVARFIVQPSLFIVVEPNGTNVNYVVTPANSKKEEKRRKHEPHRCPSILHTYPGVSNTASGTISGHTNFLNQYLMLAPDGLSFTVFAADGSKRHYKGMPNQKKQDLGYAIDYVEYLYLLHTEELPNGNKIEYKWDDHNHLIGIVSKSPQGASYASLSFPKWKNKNPLKSFQITGSDGQIINYECDYVDAKHEQHWALISIEPPDEPKRFFSHSIKKLRFGQEKIKKPFLEKITLPDGRAVSIEYEECKDILGTTQTRVKRLFSPTGSDATLQVTHTFSYFPDQRNSYIIDAKGNKTAYFWNNDQRLTRIDSYEGTDRLHHSERFVWQGTNIRCKSLFDQHQKPISARTYEYDSKGNVTVEAYYGKLTGKGFPLQTQADGLPFEEQEKCLKKTTYNERNLPMRQEESSGLIILYEYYQNTNLLKTKTLCDHDTPKITHHYEYDANLILIREITDDGLTRTIKQITPKKDAPYFGMPEIVEEKYEDQGREILLSKTILQYGKGGLIEKKDIYDANNIYRYSLHFSYDHKGHLTRETNALGWESIARYDALGNRIYIKDAADIETFFQYDASNRLIKKEEVGFDGIRTLLTYQYDRQHNLLAETDTKGHTTHYILTPQGKRAQTHLPSIATEAGTLDTPTLHSSFDSAGNEITSTDAENFSTHTEYNAYGKPLRTKYPDGTEETWTYNVDGTLRSHTDQAGIQTTHTRDYLGRVIKKTTASNKLIDLRHPLYAEESYEYYGLYPTVKIDAEGHQTRFTYDRAGRKIAETYADETTVFRYDEFSRNHCTEQDTLRTIHQFNL
ncbi:MAG TPA: hypothetical protein VGO47_14235, partial [Chlamydiales bacterium]|nr:hypothetical protein [Chlamydiales bacterium]